MQRAVPGWSQLFRQAAVAWWRDDALRLGAALAFYTIFSLAPVLVVAIAIAGSVFGGDVARQQVVTQIQGLVGPDGASMIDTLIQRAAIHSERGYAATTIAVGTILVGLRPPSVSSNMRSTRSGRLNGRAVAASGGCFAIA